MTFEQCHIKRCMIIIVPRRDVGVLLEQQPQHALMTNTAAQWSGEAPSSLFLAAMSAFLSSSSLSTPS
eukprot:CAMPEP_0113268234 /NCGR_PEP_ID=MMETSP0008_2-20120614/21053_1 /TAXON_ID=97485 /ORGANISM="Prymnesium parvum" /LENGTH=67 /DNA_ID=CAMNT_0000117359 /DNA_START=174 /DNA_END=378 /DNA_ORIENTATION=- /assembly_acc=CAM_ASM_000153